MKWHSTFYKDREFQNEEQKADVETNESESTTNKRDINSSYDYSRTNSAPLEFDAFCLFSYLENDFYTKSFSKSHSSRTNAFPAKPEESPNYKNNVAPVYTINKKQKVELKKDLIRLNTDDENKYTSPRAINVVI